MPPPAPLPCCRHTIVKNGEQLVIETASGQRITLQQSSASVLIEDANGNAIRLNPTGITISSSTKIVLSTTQVEINASTVTVNAATAKFTGVVQTDTPHRQLGRSQLLHPMGGKYLVSHA